MYIHASCFSTKPPSSDTHAVQLKGVAFPHDFAFGALPRQHNNGSTPLVVYVTETPPQDAPPAKLHRFVLAPEGQGWSREPLCMPDDKLTCYASAAAAAPKHVASRASSAGPSHGGTDTYNSSTASSAPEYAAAQSGVDHRSNARGDLNAIAMRSAEQQAGSLDQEPGSQSRQSAQAALQPAFPPADRSDHSLDAAFEEKPDSTAGVDAAAPHKSTAQVHDNAGAGTMTHKLTHAGSSEEQGALTAGSGNSAQAGQAGVQLQARFRPLAGVHPGSTLIVQAVLGSLIFLAVAGALYRRAAFRSGPGGHAANHYGPVRSEANGV